MWTQGDAFADALIDWHRKNLRDLPWRKTDENGHRDPYLVWVSEIMLQQTRIETVKGYFERFMNAFPSVEALAAAPEEEVLKLWEGLGYYSRARNLHKAAQTIVTRGSFPQTYKEILALPGVGEYTAGAILSMAFLLPEPAVDGNVLRVMSRVRLLEENVLTESAKKNVTKILKQIYPTKTASDLTEGLMELGEVICLPKGPLCESCPVQNYCLATKENRQHELPIREKTKKRTTEQREVYLVRDTKGKLLLYKRPEKGVLRGLWELPNVLAATDPKKAAGTTDNVGSDEALHTYGVRFIKEKEIAKKKHVFSHITWQMTVYEATIDDTELEKVKSFGGVFADSEEVMLPTAFKKLL